MKTLIKTLFFFTVLILCPLKRGFSQEIVLSSKIEEFMNITSNMEVFTDSSSSIPFEKILSKKFTHHQKQFFLFPYSDNTYWIKLKVTNKESDNKDWAIEWYNPLTEQLDFYISDSLGQNFTFQKQLLLTDQKVRKLSEEEITFHFQLYPKSTKTIYLRLKSQRGLYGSLRLYSAESFLRHNVIYYADQSFNFGLIFFRLFLVLILGLFIIRDTLFRTYSLQIIIKTFSFLGMMNITGPLFTSNPAIAQKIDFLSYNSFALASGLFLLVVLETKKFPKWMLYTIYASIASTVIINFLAMIDYKWYWLKAGHYNVVVSDFIVFAAYIYSIFKRLKVNIYYSIPFLLGVAANLMIFLRLFGFFEYKPIFQITTLLFLSEIFLFVVFLGQIFRSVERNKLKTEQKLQFNVIQNERLKELDSIKTTFFTNISHEFRTPLSLILSPIADLKKKYPNETALEPMRRNALRILKLINQLLDLSKLDSGKMQVYIKQDDLANFIKVLASSFSSHAESLGIDFEIIQNRTEAIAYFDADKVEKILTNLLSNAFKFTPSNGKVSLIVNYSDDFREVQISVKDSGVGINNVKIKQIFDRFFQVDGTHQRGFEGSGIGLALVKEMVELHKGTINVESKENEGSTFFIKLAIDKASWEREIKNINPEEKISSHTDFSFLSPLDLPSKEESKPQNDEENILLIVEDNDELRLYIRSVFEQDYRIVEAIDGQDGIEKALEYIPNIVISDLMMPRLDGFGFCKLLKSDEKTSHIPIVMLTAKATIESKIEGLELGADDYLTKPFDREELLVRVNNLVAQRELLRQKYDKQIVDLKPTEVKVLSIDEKFINRAIEIIEQNLSKSEFTIEQFANEMSMTSVVLRRKIKAVTNQSTTHFVRKYRLQKAANLLLHNTDTVSNIAYQVGFESLSYFTKAFQEEFEKSPSEYGK